MRFAGQGLVAQPKWDVNPVPHGWPDSGGGPVHKWPDRGHEPVHGWPDRGHGPNPYYRGRDYPGLETMEIKPGWKPGPVQPLPWDGTPPEFERKPHPHYRGRNHPGLQTMEIKY